MLSVLFYNVWKRFDFLYTSCNKTKKIKFAYQNRMNAMLLFFHLRDEAWELEWMRQRTREPQPASQPANSLLLRWAAVWMESIRAL
jgi:hypothetical protein